MSEAVRVGGILLGLLLLIAIALIAFIWLRRHRIAGSAPILLCAFRTPADQPWRLGLLHFGDRTIDWFPMVSLSTKPAVSWGRDAVEMGSPTVAAEPIPGFAEASMVRGYSAGTDFDLAMAPSGLTAIRAWLESAPPGHSAATGHVI